MWGGTEWPHGKAVTSGVAATTAKPQHHTERCRLLPEGDGRNKNPTSQLLNTFLVQRGCALQFKFVEVIWKVMNAISF